MAHQEDLKTDPDLESRIRSGPEVQHSLRQREVSKAIELDQEPLPPTEQETPSRQAAAATIGEPTAGHKADGRPRTGPATLGRESDSANPTWLQNLISTTACSLVPSYSVPTCFSFSFAAWVRSSTILQVDSFFWGVSLSFLGDLYLYSHLSVPKQTKTYTGDWSM